MSDWRSNNYKMKTILIILMTAISCFSGQTNNHDSGLVASFHFGEGAGATTVGTVGNYVATITGGMAWTTGKIGWGLTGDGTGMASFPNNANFMFGVSDFSLSTWVKITTDGELGIISKYDAAANNGYSLQVYPSIYGIRIVMNRNGGSDYILFDSLTTSVMPLKVWTHIAYTRKGSIHSMYINGTIHRTLVDAPVDCTTGNDGSLRLGSFSATYPRYITGSIDECSLWNRAITAGEVKQLYTNGKSKKE